MSLSEYQRDLDGLRRLDPQVISAVYDRYYSDVYRFVRFRLNDEAAAEDISSEVFVKLLESVRGGRGPQTNLKAWLLGTASHLVMDHHRRTYRRPMEALSEMTPDGAHDPSVDVEGREQSHRLGQALATLTEDQKLVLNLRFNEGYTLEETAAVMKKNVNAVKQMQFRALAALNRRIGDLP
jgi:RNA polymerase sigma-70 factor (ECF subfamily)